MAGGSVLVFALVLRWALGVFTRRLFGVDVGDFLFSSFVVGAVVHPLLGVVVSFLFSWAMFGKAGDAAAAVAALPLFAVLPRGWCGLVALIVLNNCFRLFRGSSALRRGVGCRLHALERGAVSEALNIGEPPASGRSAGLSRRWGWRSGAFRVL